MGVSHRYMIAAAALATFPGGAWAGCCTASPGTPVPTVNVPTVNTPSSPTPGPRPCCHGGGAAGGVGVVVGAPTIVTPSVVVPSPSIVVNHGATTVNTTLNVTTGGSVTTGGTVFVRGGGSFFGAGGGEAPSSIVLSADGAALSSETRTLVRSARIEAICMDDRNTPHPASQTFAGEAVPAAYRGEIYRCMAGTAMRYTIAGVSTDCAKGEALAYDGDKVMCRTQEARRPCNERSLLRRFGPGAKVLDLRMAETVTRARQETVRTQMVLDGGVGQGVW